MKTKVLYIIGIALIALGIVAFVVGFAGVGFDTDKLSGPAYETKTVQTNGAEITSVKIEADVADVVVKQGDEFSMTYQENSNFTFNAIINGSEIKLTEKKKWTFLVFSIRGPVISVTVPTLGANASISVENDTGDLTIDGGAYDSIRFSSDTGDATIKNAVTGTLYAESDTGEISLSKTVATTATIGSDTGDIEMNDCTYGDIKIEVDTGDIDLMQISTGTLNIESSTGDVSFKGMLSLATIETDTGDIEMELVDTGYSVSYRTNTGKARIRQDVGTKPITITTDTGDITVK